MIISRMMAFQSLSRDSGRLNISRSAAVCTRPAVSIPQSGFGAFELRPGGEGPGDGAVVSIPQSRAYRVGDILSGKKSP